MLDPLQAKALSEASDGDLLLAVAQTANRAAFDELYRRFQRPAYGLTRHLTQGAASAEDAFQEGMLRVWLYAKSYRNDGNPRGWILRTVAREALKRASSAQKDKRNMPLDEELRTPGTDNAAVQGLGAEELSVGLHRGLAELAPTHRQMVLLYYVAGMTQKEIGQELEMPTRTVSYKLEEALQRLRGSMAKAGFAAAVPALAEGQLGEALVALQPAPQGLFERVGKRIAQTPSANMASEASRRALLVSGTKALLGAVLAIAVTAGGLWFAMVAQSENPPSTPVGPVALPFINTTHASPEGFDRSWSFENGRPEDLNIMEGTWEPANLAPGLAGMRSARDVSTYVMLPTPLPKAPVRVDLELRHQTRSLSSFWGLMRGRGTDRIANDSFSRAVRPKSPESTIEATFFLFDRYNVKVTNGQVHSVRIYKGAQDGDQIVLGLQNTSVLKIRVRTITLEDFPTEYSTPEKLIENLKLVQTEWESEPMPGHGRAP